MVTPTAAQRDIRDFAPLSLLVVAPAGCGKTESLALRVAGLLERQATARHRRILVTTFSNRAMDNIRDRLRSYIKPSDLRDRVTVTNFHGLSARIFRAHASVIGLDADMVIPDSDWIRQQCHRWRWGWDAIIAAEAALREAKQQPLDDGQVEGYLQSRQAEGALRLEQQRLAEHRLTYDDLPRMAELILAHDAVADLYRNHFGAVIVDEYQDLTPQQLRIVNRIGQGKTTFAGDLAQGIYGFAGAEPREVDRAVRAECGPNVIEFAESHRSSPAVLALVNSLDVLTGGHPLTAAVPTSWPGGGLAAAVQFDSPREEASWALNFARHILAHAPAQRVGIICRTAARRAVVDEVVETSDLPVFRWDDAVLDTETARIVKTMLLRVNQSECLLADDPLHYLLDLANHEETTEPDTRRAVTDALVWCLDRIRDGLTPLDIRNRIRVGDQVTLLTAAGVHLLSGHIGKGQQFDWVIVVGVEDDVVPDWRSKTDEAVREEARVLSVMLSRARHGVIVTCARNVPTAKGYAKTRKPSRFYDLLVQAPLKDDSGIRDFFSVLDWQEVIAR